MKPPLRFPFGNVSFFALWVLPLAAFPLFSSEVPVDKDEGGHGLRIEVPIFYTAHLTPFPQPCWNGPKIGVALSGGGARGVAQLGVLEVLDSAQVPIYALSGSSIGALVGVLYAYGWTPQEILVHLEELDWNDILIDQPPRRTLPFSRRAEGGRYSFSLRLSRALTPILPGSISPGQRLFDNLLHLTLKLPYRHIEEWNLLPYKLSVVSLDLAQGKRVVLTEGDPTLAIRGSMAMPLLFDPLPLGDQLLADGGMAENIPVSAVRQWGVQKVIAVDVTSPLRDYPQPWQPWQVVDQVTTILISQPTQQSRQEADLLLQPDIAATFPIPPVKIDSLVEAGRRCARQALPVIRSWLEPASPDDSLTLTIRHCKTFYSVYKGSGPSTPTSSASLQVASPAVLYDSSEGLGHHLPSPPPDWTEQGRATVGEVKAYLRALLRSGTVYHASAQYDSTTQSLSLFITLTPFINSVTFLNLPSSLPSQSLTPLTQLAGGYFNYLDFQRGMREVLQRFRESGYPVAHFSSIIYQSDHQRLIFTFDPGRLSSIGWESSREKRGIGTSLSLKSSTSGYFQGLRGEVPLREKEVITDKKVIEGGGNLYGLEMFRWVYPSLVKDSTGDAWRLVFHLQEQPGVLLRVIANYLKEQGSQVSVQILHPTFFDRLSRHHLRFSWGTRDQHHRLSLLRDRLVGLPLVHRLELFYRYRHRDLFHYPFTLSGTSPRTDRFQSQGSLRDQSWGGNISLGGEARRWGILQVSLRWEDHWYEKRTEGASIPLDTSRYPLLAVGCDLTIDTRDRDPFPRSGFLTKFNLQRGIGVSTSSPVYSGGELVVEAYDTPVKRHSLGIRARTALFSPTTPLDLKPRWGGMVTFPGAHLDQLIGSFQLGGGVEYRYDLVSRLLADSYLGFRWDWFYLEQEGISRRTLPSLTRSKIWGAWSLYFALDTLWGPLILMRSHSLPVLGYPSKGFWWIQLGYIIN